MGFKIDWGNIIVEMVLKKDLDYGKFKDCWSENYDWTELDKHIVENFYDELIDWGIVSAEVDFNEKWSRKKVENDLKGFIYW